MCVRGSAHKGASSLSTGTQNINAGLHLNTTSGGNRKEISLMVWELTAETMGYAPHPEVTVLRLCVETAGKQRGQGSLLQDFSLVMESQERIVLEDATGEKDAQERKPISKNNRGLRSELSC